MDFTIKIYRDLLAAFQSEGFVFIPFNSWFEARDAKPATCNQQLATSNLQPYIILRHDVDARKENSLTFARIEHHSGIAGTYYFRVVPQSFDESVIREIASLGHEIGYHYETMDTCRGDVDRAYQEFCRNLEMFRKIVPIETICMHGSPLSKYDNRAIWKKYDYHSLGLIAEPYIDLDFNEVAYYTDTGRRWDGEKVSIRDKRETGLKPGEPVISCHGINAVAIDNRQSPTANWPTFHSTSGMIKAIHSGNFPSRAMMTFHPQRWTDQPVPWVRELLTQNAKNVVKYCVIRVKTTTTTTTTTLTTPTTTTTLPCPSSSPS